MATRTVKHNEHEHSVRTVNETIQGLVIDDRDTDSISGAFGWDEEDFRKMTRAYIAFGRFQEAAQELDEDLPRGTMTSVLVEFLKSDTFKRLGIKLTTPNDYFMLGFIFNSSRSFDDFEEKMRAGALKIGSTDEFLKFLKKIKEEMEG
jgi:hypothetical protein